MPKCLTSFDIFYSKTENMCEFPREKNIAMLCNTNLWAGSMKGVFGVFGGKRAKILKMVVYASETFSQRDLSQNVSRKPEENFKIHSTSTGILLSIQKEKISIKDIVLCTQKYTPTKFCKSTLVFHNFVIFFYQIFFTFTFLRYGNAHTNMHLKPFSIVGSFWLGYPNFHF